VRRGGTAIALRDEPKTICVECNGSVVELGADVLKCRQQRAMSDEDPHH